MKTDKQVIEKALLDSDTLFRNYFNMPLHGIAVTSPEKGWLHVNDRLCVMLGYSREEITKMTWLEMTHPDDLAADEEQFNRVLSGQIEYYNLNKRFIRKDKTIIWTNLSVGCVRKPDGQVDYIIVLLDDITENKAKEEILETKTALLEAQLNATGDGILVIDKDKKRIITNKRIIELFNIPQAIQDDKNDAVLLEYVVGLTKNPKQFLEKVLYLYDHPNETSSDEIEFKSGLILARYSAPVLGDDGTNYGRIWTFRDITKQKELENLFLKEKQEQQIILDAIPAWVFYKDTKNDFIRVNQAFATAMGLSKDKLEGKSLFDVFPKEQADKFLKDDNEVIKTGQPKIGIIEPIESSKGTLWVQTDKIPYRNNLGNIIGVIGFTIDITAQKNAEDKIKIHSEEIEKMNQFMVDRELKMVELKEEIAELKKQPKL